MVLQQPDDDLGACVQLLCSKNLFFILTNKKIRIFKCDFFNQWEKSDLLMRVLLASWAVTLFHSPLLVLENSCLASWLEIISIESWRPPLVENDVDWKAPGGRSFNARIPQTWYTVNVLCTYSIPEGEHRTSNSFRIPSSQKTSIFPTIFWLGLHFLTYRISLFVRDVGWYLLPFVWQEASSKTTVK